MDSVGVFHDIDAAAVIAGEVGHYLDLAEAIQETGVDLEEAGFDSRDLLDLEARGGIEYLEDVSRVQLFKARESLASRVRSREEHIETCGRCGVPLLDLDALRCRDTVGYDADGCCSFSVCDRCVLPRDIETRTALGDW